MIGIGHWLTILLASVLACASLSCRDRGRGSNASPQTFQARGVVQEVMPDRKKVRIAHENIPNYMDAMTMDFDVKDAKQLEGLAGGDQVTFRMVVTDKDGWIEQIRKTGNRTKVAAPPDSFVRVRDVEPLKPGDQVPNYQFTNQMGQVVRFDDYRGQALAFTFIFTRCPFPTFCPRMSSLFSEAQQQLQAKGMPTNWHLLTISFDPEFDTPEVLRGYAKGHNANPARWTFATGQLSNIVDLAQQAGLVFYKPDPANPASINHNLRTVVVDAAGKLQKVFTDNEWKPEDLVAEIVKAAASRRRDG